MDLAALRAAFYSNIGVTTTDQYYPTATVDGYINKAIRRIGTEHDWPWNEVLTTLTTVAGTGTLSLTGQTGWYKTRILHIEPYGALELYPLAQLLNTPTSFQGIPNMYAIQADSLLVRPVPNAVYTINHVYYVIETTLTNTTDTPRLPAQYHDAIVDLAVYYGCVQNKEQSRYSPRATQYLEQYQAMLKVMRDNVRRTSATQRVRVRPGSQI
jgi:hypothetical protein